jgi:hypothetical protein
MTWWLSFAGGEPDRYLGAVLVDGASDFLSARMLMMLAGVKSPGGECMGIPVEPHDVPPEYWEAFAALPRLTLLSKDDLRVLGPLVNTDGEDVA